MTIKRDQEIAQAATPRPWYIEREACDCGGGYPCSHGDWPHAIHMPTPMAEHLGKDPIPSYAFSRCEISELTDADADLVANARNRFPLYIDLALAAAELGLETTCLSEPQCGNCRACRFQAALAACNSLDTVEEEERHWEELATLG